MKVDEKLYVASKKKPGEEWVEYPTRTLSQLKDYTSGDKDQISRYGGWKADKTEATGYFYAKKANGRWWLIDPEGYRFIHVGVAAIGIGSSENSAAALKKKYSSGSQWMEETLRKLRDAGFCGAGAWSEVDLISKAPAPITYTKIWNFMSSYGKIRGGIYQKAGHIGYPKNCMFVFDKEFESFCDEHAKKLAETKDDPWLLGHFSDNELPLPQDALDNYLSLEQEEPGYKAALLWLQNRGKNNAAIEEIDDSDREEFLGYLVETYSNMISKAIKKYDPNHLYLGSRLHSRAALNSPSVFKAAGRYADVISVNYYNNWTPEREKLINWEKNSGKPVIITEWYTKGEDSGMGNTSGAGWIVKTQKDRGLFYQNFVLELLESKNCVGWHWFKFMDNDPEDKTVDPSNTDANKGIVNIHLEYYEPLLEKMKELNIEVYSIIKYFDSVK